MALFDKVFFARLFIVGTLASLIATGVVFINPINEYSSVTNGTCKIYSIAWTKLWCEGSFEEYYVPQITASFRNVTYFGYRVSSYTGLYVNKDRLNDIKATIFDDGTDDALVHCEWPGIQAEINTQLAAHIPELNNVTGFDPLNDTILVDMNFTNMEWFPCFHRVYSYEDELYLNFKKPNYYLSAFFGLSLFLHFVSSVFVTKVDESDSIFAQVGTLGVMLLYVIHLGLFTILVYIPALVFGKKNDVPDGSKLFEKGSILIPLFWLLKKCRKTCTSSSPPPSPNLSRRRSVPAPNNVTVELATPRRIQRRLSIEATASIQSLATQPDLSDATAVSVGHGPPQYGNLVIENSGTDGDGLPPPPSYDEVVKGGSSRV